MMIKSLWCFVIPLFLFVSLVDFTTANQTVVHHQKLRRNHKKDAKSEYYLREHIDHPDVDAETIKKHGVSLEDAKMQADGLYETKSKQKKNKIAAESIEDGETQLQDMVHHNKQNKPHQRRHHRHEVKVHEKAETVQGSVQEEISPKEGIKEKKLTKSRTESTSEILKSEVKVNGTKSAEPVKHTNTGSKSKHSDKKRRGHKHGNPSGHKNKKHGGKKSHKQLDKYLKGKKDKKMRKHNHQEANN